MTRPEPPPRLVRTGGTGFRVHLPTCRFAANAAPWRAADAVSVAELRRWIAANGMAACRTCKPLEHLDREGMTGL